MELTPDVQLWHGDCLTEMARIADGSVDLIAADLPYAVTACRWDVIIPFEPLWAHYKRIIKPRGAIVLTASQPFTSALVMSNAAWFRYEDVWDKISTTGFLDAKRRPLRRHESVLLFSGVGTFTFNPQMRTGKFRKKGNSGPTECYGKFNRVISCNDQYYPTSIIAVSNANQRNKVHSTQKPVALFEYLIRTYTNPGELVLDNSCGSGTTLVAAMNTGRRAIGIELDAGYFKIATDRIAAAQTARAELPIPA